MYITHLKLINFRAHHSTDLELSRLNVIRGANGSGKSSIQMALEFALTGRCDVTDQAGRGAQDLVTTGKSELGVQIVLQGGAIVTRTRNQAGTTLIVGDGKKSFSGKVADGWLQSQLGLTGILSAVLNAHRFLEMKPPEQVDLLARALTSDPVAVPADILQLIAEAGAHAQPEWKLRSVAEIEETYKDFYELRASMNRLLKSLGEHTAPERPEDMPRLADVRSKITTLLSQRDELVRARATTLEKHRQGVERYRQSEETRTRLEAELKELDGQSLETAELDKLRKLSDRAPKAGALRQSIATIQQNVTDLRGRISKLKEPQESNCPTCGQPVVLEDRSGYIAEFEAELTKAEADLSAKQIELTKLGDPESAIEKVTAHKTAQARSLKINAELNALPKNEPGGEPDLSKEDAEIGTIDQRLTNGRSVEEQVIRFEEALKRYTDVAEQKAKVEKELVAVEKLVTAFGPNSPLRGKLVNQKLPAFTDRMNQVLVRFGFACSFTLSPYRITVAVHGSTETLSLNQLSESEAYRFGIAFQVALAEVTGVGLVVIDRADMLTADSRTRLSQELMSSRLDQAFVLSTAEEHQLQQIPQIPDVAFFTLENNAGAARILAPIEVPA